MANPQLSEVYEGAAPVSDSSEQSLEERLLNMSVEEFRAFVETQDFAENADALSAFLITETAQREAIYSKIKRGYLPNNKRASHYDTLASDFRKYKDRFAMWRERMLANRVQWFEAELEKVGITGQRLKEMTDDLTRGLESYHKSPKKSAFNVVPGGQKTVRAKVNNTFLELREKLQDTFGKDTRKLRSIYNKMDGWALSYAQSARIKTAAEGIVEAAEALNERTLLLQKHKDQIHSLNDKLDVLREWGMFAAVQASKAEKHKLKPVENIPALQQWLFPRAQKFRAALSSSVAPLFNFMTKANDARPKLLACRDMFKVNAPPAPGELLADDLTKILNMASGIPSREPEVKGVIHVLDAQAQDGVRDVMGMFGVENENPFVEYVAECYEDDKKKFPDADVLSRVFRVAQHVDTELGVANNNRPATLGWNGQQTMRVTYQDGAPPSGPYDVNVKVVAL